METDEELPGFARWLFECTSIVVEPTKRHKRREYHLNVDEDYDAFLKDAGDALAMLPQIKSLAFWHSSKSLNLGLTILSDGYQILTIYGPLDKVGEHLKRMLSGNATVERVEFDSMAFEVLHLALETTRNVRRLEFSTRRQSANVVGRTLKIFEEPGRLLTTLAISGYVDKSIGQSIERLITRVMTLERLTVIARGEKGEASCSVFSALKSTNSLTKLVVVDRGEPNKSAPLLFDALSRNDTLVSVYVDKIPNALFLSMLAVFRTNCTLRHLRCDGGPVYELPRESLEEAERILSEAYAVVELPKILPKSPVIKERLKRNAHNHAMHASSLVAVMLDFLEEWTPKHQYQSFFDNLSLGFKQRRTLALSANI